jgi:tetratricopeptide (TPR) repeat protein
MGSCFPPRSKYSDAAAKIALFYKESPYYKYAYYWLGHDAELAFNSKEALECYSRFLKEQPHPLLVEEAKYRMALVEEKCDRTKDATPIIAAIAKETEDLDLARDARRELDKREKSKKPEGYPVQELPSSQAGDKPKEGNTAKGQPESPTGAQKPSGQ